MAFALGDIIRAQDKKISSVPCPYKHTLLKNTALQYPRLRRPSPFNGLALLLCYYRCNIYYSWGHKPLKSLLVRDNTSEKVNSYQDISPNSEAYERAPLLKLSDCHLLLWKKNQDEEKD
jgi:hypothetical protein